MRAVGCSSALPVPHCHCVASLLLGLAFVPVAPFLGNATLWQEVRHVCCALSATAGTGYSYAWVLVFAWVIKLVTDEQHARAHLQGQHLHRGRTEQWRSRCAVFVAEVSSTTMMEWITNPSEKMGCQGESVSVPGFPDCPLLDF